MIVLEQFLIFTEADSLQLAGQFLTTSEEDTYYTLAAIIIMLSIYFAYWGQIERDKKKRQNTADNGSAV